LGGEAVVEFLISADGVFDIAFGVEVFELFGGRGDHGGDRAGVAAGHGEDEVGLVDEFDGEGTGAVLGEVCAECFDGFDGLGSGAHAGHGDGAGGDDLDAFFIEIGWFDAEAVSEDFFGQRLGHGRTAGVAGADEEDGGFEQALNDALVVDAGADDFVAVGGDADEGGGFV